MSGPIKDGGPAFPLLQSVHPYPHGHGMMLRDWFAGQALVGTLAMLQPEHVANMMRGGMTQTEVDRLLARSAYRMADLMLAAREARS